MIGLNAPVAHSYSVVTTKQPTPIEEQIMHHQQTVGSGERFEVMGGHSGGGGTVSRVHKMVNSQKGGTGGGNKRLHTYYEVWEEDGSESGDSPTTEMYAEQGGSNQRYIASSSVRSSGTLESGGTGGYRYIPSKPEPPSVGSKWEEETALSQGLRPSPPLYTSSGKPGAAMVSNDRASQASFSTHKLKNVNGGPYPVTGMHTYTGDPVFPGLNHNIQWQDPYRVSHPVVGSLYRNPALFQSGVKGSSRSIIDGSGLPDMDHAQTHSLAYRDAMRHYDTIGATNGAIQYQPNPRYSMRRGRGLLGQGEGQHADFSSVAATQGSVSSVQSLYGSGTMRGRSALSRGSTAPGGRKRLHTTKYSRRMTMTTRSEMSKS